MLKNQQTTSYVPFFIISNLYNQQKNSCSRDVGVCLEYSIWGTNNQLTNKFYKFFQLQLFDVKFLFQKQPPEVFYKKRYFPVNFAKFFTTTFLRNTSGWLLLLFPEKQNIIADRRERLLWTRINDNILSSRHK